MEALSRWGWGVRGGLKEEVGSKEPLLGPECRGWRSQCAPGDSLPGLSPGAEQRRREERLSSPPRVRTPPRASLARAHAALGNFATTSPRVSARRGEQPEKRGPSPQGPSIPSPRPLPQEEQHSSRRRSQPARWAAHGAGAAGARAPRPPLPAENGTSFSRSGAGSAGPRGRRKEGAPRGEGGGRGGCGRPSARERAPLGVPAAPSRPAVAARSPRPQTRDPGPGARASPAAQRPRTCAAPSPGPASRGQPLAHRKSSEASSWVGNPEGTATSHKEKAAPTRSSLAHCPLC